MSDLQAIADRVEIVALWDFFVPTTHPGTIQLDGDTASGRMRSQINLIRAAADPRSRRSLGEQI